MKAELLAMLSNLQSFIIGEGINEDFENEIYEKIEDIKQKLLEDN